MSEYKNITAREVFDAVKNTAGGTNWPIYVLTGTEVRWFDKATDSRITATQAAHTLEGWAYDYLRESGWKCYNSTVNHRASGVTYVYPYIKDDSEVVGKGPTPLHALTEVIRQIHAQPAKVEASGATNPSDDELDIGWKITIQSGSMDVWIQHDNKNKHVLMVIEERPGGDIPVGFVSLDIRGLVELRKAIDAAIERIKETP
jgi:hypothetical protein